MSECNHRIYKGEDVDVVIPFDVSGYSSFSASFYTNSTAKIERAESGLTFSAGTIIAHFENTELDILPDGVLRYTLNYRVDETDYVQSSNFSVFLKTPIDYSAKTIEEYYQSGYTSGHTDGIAEQKALLVSTAITSNGTYTKEDGYNSVSVNVPDEGRQGLYFGRNGYGYIYRGYYGVHVEPNDIVDMDVEFTDTLENIAQLNLNIISSLGASSMEASYDIMVRSGSTGLQLYFAYGDGSMSVPLNGAENDKRLKIITSTSGNEVGIVFVKTEHISSYGTLNNEDGYWATNGMQISRYSPGVDVLKMHYLRVYRDFNLVYDIGYKEGVGLYDFKQKLKLYSEGPVSGFDL